jgi:PAS domain S-box-containing protein
MEFDADAVELEWVFEQFAETNPDVLFMFSPDWSELLFANDAYEDIWGESVERLEADPGSFLERVHPDDRESVAAKMERLSNGEPIENEFRVLPADERGPEVRHVWSESRPVFDDETGELVALTGFVRDITDRKEYEQELERTNERLETFAQFLSHDIRNQLTIADGHLRFAREGTGDSEHLETVERALERVQELTDDILALVDLGEGSLEREEVVVAELARTCWASEDIDASAGTLVVEDNATIYVSQNQFRAVFENLFRNAVEHTDTDPEVRVGVLPGGDGVYVEDDGEGIDPGEAETVFEFGQTSGGTGLGLTLVREVVRLHGGEISVTAGEESGARFEIALPGPDVPTRVAPESSESSS